MSPHHNGRSHTLRTVAGGLALVTVPYAAYVASTWYGYGRRCARSSRPGSRAGSLIERFMPVWEVAERHEIQVDAPAEYTFAAARDMDVHRSTLVRAIFGLRTLPSRWRHKLSERPPTPLLAETLALGWRLLAEIPGREIAVGAVTQPWRTDVEFRGVDPDAFAGFKEPGYAKIAWTLEAEPLGPMTSRFRTETRVSTTDPRSRRLFRRYWALLSLGILLIRRESLKLVKAEAERRFQASTPGAGGSLILVRPEGVLHG
jgi:hypothetical protein